MELTRNNPILLFRNMGVEHNNEVEVFQNLITGLTDRNKNNLNKSFTPAGSFITLTREAIDSTEASGR